MESNQSAAEPAHVTITQKQQRVLVLLARGASYQQIATKLFVSTATPRSHIAQLRDRFGTASNISLVLAAAVVGVLSTDVWPIEATGLLEFDPARITN